MILFDTNIFLEILLDQKSCESCEKALALISEDRPGWVSSFSMHAIEAIVGAAKNFSVLKKFIQFVQEHPYLNCYVTTLKEELEVSKLASHLGLDFDDALQYFVARERKMVLVTLDKHFKKFKEVQILTPEAFIEYVT